MILEDKLDEILRTTIPDYIASNIKENILCVKIKNENLEDYIGVEEFPLLQKINMFRGAGIELHTDFNIENIDEEFSNINFSFTHLDEIQNRDGIDWRALLEIDVPPLDAVRESSGDTMDFLKLILR